MSHRIRLLAQFDQGASDSPRDIIESQVADFSSRVSQAVGHLLTYGKHNLRMRANIGIEIGITDFGNLTGSPGTAPGTAFFSLLKQTHLTKEISRVEIGDDYFLAIIVFQYHRYRTLDDVIEGIALITFVDDSCPVWISFPMAMGQEVIQVLDVRRYSH